MASENRFQSANKIIVSVDNGENSELSVESERKIEGNGERKREKMNGSADLLCVPRTGHRLSFMEVESFKEKSRLNLLKQISAILKQREQKYNKEALHKAFQDEDLLERIFLLFDVERQDYLVQEDWIEFLKERLTEEKQQDFVEQIESVAYVVCGENVITVESFQLILKNKVVTNKLLRVVDTGGDGSVTADDIMEFISAISSCRPRVGIDKPSIDRLEQLFQQTVGDQKEITREQFQKIVVSKNPFFTERVFQIFDEDNSGTISHQEFIAAVHRFGRQTPEDKIRFLFKVYDLDGDGLIQHRELQHVMRACMEENGMQFSDEQLMDLTGAMFEDADNEGRGAITYEALKDQLNKHEGLLENLSITIDRWLVPPPPKQKPKSFLQRLAKMKPYQLSVPYFKNNYVFVSYLFLFFVINFGLFVARIVEYWNSNVFVIFARACGQCLNFNCTWALVLMLRRCITSLRTRGLGEVLPLDHHVYLHKITGVLIVVYSVIHTIMHLCNFSLVVVNDPVLNARNWTTWEWVCTSRPGLFGLCGGCANPSGIVLLAALVALAAASRPKLRAGGYFEVFYFTHLLYIPFYVILIIHAPNFWKWFIGPGTIYIIERIVRLNWMSSLSNAEIPKHVSIRSQEFCSVLSDPGYTLVQNLTFGKWIKLEKHQQCDIIISEKGKTYIASGILLPSLVTHLVIKRPPLFDFHAGDYVFVNIPAIAVYEWHPFTISSAPEQEDYLWLHIRGVGEWTNRLYSYFEEQQQRLHGNDEEHTKLAKTISNQSNKSKRNGSIASAKKRSVEFSPISFTNAAFTMEDEKTIEASPTPTKPARSAFLSPLRLLEKSRSVPDMRNNMKKNGSKLTLGECHRWESERELVDAVARRGRRVARGGDGALAQSFRYMRTKPTVLDFAPPVPDIRRRSNESILSIAKRRLSKGLTPEKDVESMVVAPDPVIVESTSDQHPDYPIGRPLEIYLDGPYGAASSRMFRAQHAVLIAAGIGVTPFASVLQAIMFRYRSARSTCPKCEHSWTKELPHHNMSLRKVDFFWINREQRSFEWFVSLLSQLEMEQAEGGGERFLELHMFVTSALQRADMRAVGLQLALDLLHQKEKRDLITGLKTRTNAGRPNWDKVFQRLQEQRKGKVTVFYCGPPQLARILRVKCDQFGFNFCKEPLRQRQRPTPLPEKR